MISYLCSACGWKWIPEPIWHGGSVLMGAIVYPITCKGCGKTYDGPSGMKVKPNGIGDPLVPRLHHQRKSKRGRHI